MEHKFFELIPSGFHFDFVGKAKIFVTISIVAVAISIGSIVTKGFHYGVDFTGGTEIYARFTGKPDARLVRSTLEPIGFHSAIVQGIGERDGGEFIIRVEESQVDIGPSKSELQKVLNALSPGSPAKIRFSVERLYVTFDADVPSAKVEEALKGASLGALHVDSVSLFGKPSNHEYLVQFAGVASRIVSAFQGAFGKANVEVLQVDQVGPKVGAELRLQAIGAVLISLLLILIYVWFRFDIEFAPGAILSLAHDALLILGITSLFDLTFDLSTLAAVLTIVGFSINDTIVVYDRVRENIRKSKDPNFVQVVNDSINQTLGRTILTSGTVLLTTLSLLIFGGPVTFNFALAFTVGIISGTYSTIFVALIVTIYLRNYLLHRRRLTA